MRFRRYLRRRLAVCAVLAVAIAGAAGATSRMTADPRPAATSFAPAAAFEDPDAVAVASDPYALSPTIRRFDFSAADAVVSRAPLAAAGPAATAAPAVVAARLRTTLTPTVLHFHGNPTDDSPCTGDGSADVTIVACNGPKLKTAATLGTGPPGHWDPPQVSNNTAARNQVDPNWLWSSGAVRLGGPMTIEWWASCGACRGALTANWMISVWADTTTTGTYVREFQTTVTATPALPDVPSLLTANLFLIDNQAPFSSDGAINAKGGVVLTIDPVFIDTQENTHIYYDSQSPCPGVVETPARPCDSQVTFPVLDPNEPPPPPPTPGTPNPTYTTGGLTFGPATVVDTQRTEGEPVNFIDSNGTYWESGPYGTSTQLSFVHRSTDGGDQFNVVSPYEGRPDPPPGGGDTDVVADDQGYPYFTDLEGLANISCAVSNDGGNNWKKNPVCIQPEGVDRQWLAVDNGPTSAATDNTVFHSFRQAALGSFIWSTPGSTGPSDNTGGVVYTNSSGAGPDIPVNTGAPCGQLRFDQRTRYLFYPCKNGNQVKLTVAHVNPSQRTGIAYATVDTPTTLSGQAIYNLNFPIVTSDSAGNIYVVWTDSGCGATALCNRDIEYVASTDFGNTWGPVIRVNSPPSRSNVWPWARGGSEGNLVVTWYGVDSDRASDNMPAWSSDPVGANAYKWYGYAAFISNAQTLNPTIDQNRFTPKPMHYGQICTSGTTCTGDRTMADYFANYLDRDGSIRIIFNDTTSQYHGAHLFETRQLAGPSATGGTVAKATPGTPMADPAGDAQTPHFSPTGTGTNQPQLDFRVVSVSQPDPSALHVQMTVNNLSSKAPPPGKTNAFWITRFQALSYPDLAVGQTAPAGEAYRIFYVGAESVNGAAPTFFAGSGSSTAEPPNCNASTPGNCKVVQYPAETTATGSINGNTICIDVASFKTSGFGANRPINGTTLYNVMAFSGGRDDAVGDLYEEGDATRSFDYTLDSSTQAGCVPTAVRLVKFSARPEHRRVVLRWQTAAEHDALGFYVWRRSGGLERKVNRALVRATGRVSGASYRVVDRTARAGRSYTYRLQIVDRRGHRSWSGAVGVRLPR